MIERIFPASAEQLEPVQEFILEQVLSHPCSQRIQFQLNVAVEEILVNIAHYAYPPEQQGTVLIRCDVTGEPPVVRIQFVDTGVAFNPLKKPDADTTLPAEQRSIGGLGILMVKKSMDAVDYAYENGKNILTIRKQLSK